MPQTLKFLVFAIFSLFLTACSTMVKPLDSIYWRGKDVSEFFERKRLPDTAVQCVKENELSYIYGYQLSLYDLQTYEVGRDATTIYMRTDKVYTGGTTWTYLFADANNKITSVRETTGFGDIEKEFKCDAYKENVNISTDDLAKRKVKKRLWSAIYISPAQNVAAGNDDPSPNLEDAKKDALKACTSHGGKNCQLQIAFSNMCLSFSQGEKKGKIFDAVGHSLNASEADRLAIESCEKQGGSNCRISRNALCNMPCDILSDNQCMFDQPQWVIPDVNNGKPIDLPADSSML